MKGYEKDDVYPDDVLAFGDIDYNRLIKRKNFLTNKESDSLSWIHEQMKKYDMNQTKKKT